jgi:hypothetical protein
MKYLSIDEYELWEMYELLSKYFGKEMVTFVKIGNPLVIPL